MLLKVAFACLINILINIPRVLKVAFEDAGYDLCCDPRRCLESRIEDPHLFSFMISICFYDWHL